MNASEALVNLLLGELGLAILVGGAVGLLLLWYIRGRDKPHGLVADYLREPPSDLHPGLVGTLLDEHANSHDVVATLVNLGHRGALRIETPTRSRLDYRLTLLRRDIPFSPVEQLLIDTLFGTMARPVSKSVVFYNVRARFVAAIPKFKVALYEEVVAAGFFIDSPRATRLRYRRWGASIMVLTPLLGLPAAFFIPGFRLLLIPTVTLTVIGLALYHLARVMPAKTAQGVEEAARWRAFRRYLAQIERYENLNKARGIFERYLPYAIAFGLDKEWVQKFTRTQAAAPAWLSSSTTPLRSVRRERRRGRGGGGNFYIGDSPSLRGGSGGGIDLQHMPNLGGVAGGIGNLAGDLPDRVSAAGGAGLEAASDALADLLDTAATVFDW